MAVNVANRGYLPDVADGAIVEVGATVDGDGVHPDTMPPLGEPLAGWVATQVELQDLVVSAALERDPDLAFQALREDPNSPPDEASCRRDLRRADGPPGRPAPVLTGLACRRRRLPSPLIMATLPSHYHVGIVVPDLAAARTQLTQQLGVGWGPVFHLDSADYREQRG